MFSTKETKKKVVIQVSKQSTHLLKNYFVVYFHYFDILTIDLRQRQDVKMQEIPNQNSSLTRGTKLVK